MSRSSPRPMRFGGFEPGQPVPAAPVLAMAAHDRDRVGGAKLSGSESVAGAFLPRMAHRTGQHNDGPPCGPVWLAPGQSIHGREKLSADRLQHPNAVSIRPPSDLFGFHPRVWGAAELDPDPPRVAATTSQLQ